MHFQRKGRLHRWKWRPPSIQVKPLRIESLKQLKHSITQEMERIFQLQDLIPSLNHKSVEIQDILDKFWNHQRIKKSYRESSSMNLLKWRMVCCFFWWWLRKHRKKRRKTVSVIENIFPEHHLQTWAQSRVTIDTNCAPRSPFFPSLLKQSTVWMQISNCDSCPFYLNFSSTSIYISGQFRAIKRVHQYKAGQERR